MTATGSLVIQGNISSLPSGTISFGPVSINSSAAIGELLTVALSIGANTIAIPIGATAVIIQGPQAAIPAPNPPYGGVLTLKGISGDTGIAISGQWPTVIPIASTVTSIVLNATVSTSVTIWVL